MPADTAILPLGTESTPALIEIPGALEFIMRAVYASYDGTSATSSFVPALQLLTGSGEVAGTWPLDSKIAAGGSADVSWFPGVTSTTSVYPNTGATTLDYAQITSSVYVTGTTGSPTDIITGSAVTYDGASQVLVEVYTPSLDVGGNGNIVVVLYEDSTDLARLGQLDIVATGVTDVGTPAYMARFITPPSGSHTYSVKGWTTTPAVNPYFGAGSGSGGSSSAYMPAFMRVSSADLL